MAEERQIDAISIGIGANVSGLKASLAAAQNVVSNFKFKPPEEAAFNLTVGLNTGVVQNKLDTFIKKNRGREVPLSIVLTPTRESLRDFRSTLKEKLNTGNEQLTIPFKADLKSARVIRNSIQTALNQTPFTIQIAWEWKNGPPPAGGTATGGGGGPAPTGPTPTSGTAAPTTRPATSTAGPRLVTRPARPVTGRATQLVIPKAPVVAGGLPPRYTPAPSRSNTEFQPGIGAARAQGLPPNLDQRLKRGIAHLMRTGDPSDIFSILGPFQAMTGDLGKFKDYNLPGLNGEQVNLKQLIDQAMGFATNYGQRRGANQPLREFQEFVPREARFSPDTMDRAGMARIGMARFIKSAQGRAVANQGVYSEQDIGIANKLRTYLNSIQTQMHAEDPKAFKMAFDVRRGSVSRLKDMGLMELAGLGGVRAGLKGIGPASPDLLDTLAASERHNKQLQTNENRIANARKRAQGADREAQTVINEQTGRKRTIPSRGLPYVQSTGTNTVQAFLDMLTEAEQDKDFFATKRKGFALGGKIKLKMLLGSGHYDPAAEDDYPDTTYPGGEYTHAVARLEQELEAEPRGVLGIRPLKHPNQLKNFSKNALGGHMNALGYALGGHLGGFDRFRSALRPYFPNASIVLPNADKQTEDLMAEVSGMFAQMYPRSAEELETLRLMTPEERLRMPKAAAITGAHSQPGASIYGPRLRSSVAFDPRNFKWPGISAAHDYRSQLTGYHPLVSKRYAGVSGHLSHELGHVLDNTHLSQAASGLVRKGSDLLSPSDVFAAKLVSGYAKDALGISGTKENFAEHFTSFLLGGDPDQSHDTFRRLSDIEGGRSIGSGRATGGRTPWGKSGAVVVGEQGDEVFVPESAGWIIPHRLMDQLPKRAGGGDEGAPKQPRIKGRFTYNDPQAAVNAAFQAGQQSALGPTGQPATAKAGGSYVNPGDLAPGSQARGEYEAAIQAGRRPSGITALTPEEAMRIKFDVRESEDPERRAAVLRKGGVKGDVAQAAARAFGPDMGQFAATQFGRAGVVMRQGLAQLAEQDVSFARTQIASVRQQIQKSRIQLGGLEEEGNVEGVDKMRGQIEELYKAEAVAVQKQEEYTKGAELASSKVATLGDKLKVLGSNFSGILVGTVIYGTVFKGIQTALSAAVPALGSFIDEQTGLHAKATQVTGALGDQITAAHGNADAVLASAAAEAGLNKNALDLLSTQLKLTSTIKAGATAQGAASDLFRGAAGVGGGAPQGLFGGYGGVLGSGFLAQQLGGGKGFSETVQGDLSNLSRPQGGSDVGSLINQGLSYVTNPDFQSLINAQAQKTGQQNPFEANFPLTTAILGGLGDWIHGGPPNNPNADAGFIGHGPVGQALGGLGDLIFRGGKAPTAPPTAAEQQNQTNALATAPGGLVQGYLQNLNENIAKVGGTAKYTYAGTDAAGQALRDAGVAAAKAAGDLNGMTSASQGFVVTIGGAAAGTKEYTAALEEAARGAALPSAAVVQAAMTRQREITQGTIQAQTAFQTGTLLPQQNALQYYANQPLTPGTGIVPPTGAAGYGGISAAAQLGGTDFGKYKSQATSAFDYVRGYAEQGFNSLKNAGVTGLDQYKAIGDQILSIQTDLAKQTAVQSAVQYNHQLYITNRSLQDAVALTGARTANEQTNLGFLQRQDYLLGRQSTSLSLALSQKQINFQTAVAGFQAPGLTSEERQARIDEAKVEASYAQKQLDISKQQFTVAGRIFNVSAVRQLKDVQFALADLQAGHRIEINTKSAMQAIGALQGELGIQGAQIGAQISKEEAIFSAKISESATIAATATGQAFSEILKGVSAAWTTFEKGANGYAAYVAALNPQGTSYAALGRATTGSGPTSKSGVHAAGYLGMVSGATSMIVGEAGAETVAILRNPRPGYTHSMGGAGGGGNVYIVNPSVRNDDDLTRIVTMVEKALQARAKMTLPRS